jgi:hypothetical protein
MVQCGVQPLGPCRLPSPAPLITEATDSSFVATSIVRLRAVSKFKMTIVVVASSWDRNGPSKQQSFTPRVRSGALTLIGRCGWCA